MIGSIDDGVVLMIADQFNEILWVIVAGVSLVPFLIFLVSQRRVRSQRLLILTFAFLLFFIKSATLAMKPFIQNYNDEFWWSIAAVLDVSIISLITYALVKKK